MIGGKRGILNCARIWRDYCTSMPWRPDHGSCGPAWSGQPSRYASRQGGPDFALLHVVQHG